MKDDILDIQDPVNRVVIHEKPKLLRRGESFHFDGKVYTSKDESIMVRSNATTGKIFSPTEIAPIIRGNERPIELLQPTNVCYGGIPEITK